MEASADDELAQLLRAVIGGDEITYEQFLCQMADNSRSFARKIIVKGGLDSEDVVQDTLLAIDLKRHTWRADGLVLPWPYAIARHKLIDGLHQLGKRNEVEINEIAENFTEPEVRTVSEDDLNRALESLASSLRVVVSSVSVAGCSIGEPATTLGMTETPVRVTLHRARGLKTIFGRFGKS